jgi:hypothetical protein
VIRSILFILFLLPFGNAQKEVQSTPKRTPVEVFSHGENGFKQRLGKSLKEILRSSSEFSLNQAKNPAALIVTISSFLDWRDGTEISCTVEFSSTRNEILGISIASCMSNDLAKCTTQILKDAKIAAYFLVNPAPKAIPSTIPEIKANSRKYDERVVQISGYFSSGHLGVSLDSKDHSSGIRLRSPGGNDVPCPVPIFRNELFNKFWEMPTEAIDFDLNKKEIRTTVEGFVRVLKVNGKPATEFDVFGQWPLEIIVTRIISIEIEEEPMWKNEHPPLLPSRSRNQPEQPEK